MNATSANSSDIHQFGKEGTLQPPYGKYSYMFTFEETFHYPDAKNWFQNNWTISFWASGIYVLVIFSLQKYMRNRQRFELKKALIVWNSLLAVFSIVGAFRTVPETVYVLQKFGLSHSCCVPSYLYEDKVSSCWSLLFALSKLPELGDTLFIVLRKAPLIFLHWYHHTTVLMYSWYAYRESTPVARWFVVMNFTVHSFMYFYFALRAAGKRLPKFLPMLVTGLQLLQMLVGTLVNTWSLQYINSGTPCTQTRWNVSLALLMYATYFGLFLQFFVRSYVFKMHSSIEKKVE